MHSMQLRKVSNALGFAAVLGVGAVLVAPTPAQAAFPTATFLVSAQINANCTISANPLAFGAYYPVVAKLTTALNGNGSVVIACTKGSAPNITLDLGKNAVGNQRNMLNTGNTDVLGYQLYFPTNNTTPSTCTFPGTTVWGTTAPNIFVPSTPTSKAPRTFLVCGTVAPGQDVSVGTYNDTITATVTF